MNGILQQILLFSVFCSFKLHTLSSNDPFSKVTITSTNAQIQKQILSYKNKVNVAFADETNVSSDFLQITLSKDIEKFSSCLDATAIQSLFLEGNIKINYISHVISAQRAEITMQTKLCILSDNVKIEQKKVKDKDIPLSTQCSKASFNLETKDITFEGSDVSPVMTTLVLKNAFSKKQFTKPNRQSAR